ncbi:hypothetical protein [Salinimicrobium sediminilitoris]|uniref:hypothetical protein n=1 Tax=Salinimicrobium sediminilitoris TaxID=2876715 RepID=UPI001E5A73BA|nr:hypothetical protein [Salinimicrobium sediminilitoris]MCC8360257.1 hypothetical protein [Salinimicrobium sediminilitoris]
MEEKLEHNNCEFYTKKRVYTPADVIEEFADKVQIKNIRSLVEHLSHPSKAAEIAYFKEQNEELYFSIGGYWEKEGFWDEIPHLPSTMAEEELEYLGKEKILKMLERISERVRALHNVIVEIELIPLADFRRVYRTGGELYFQRNGLKSSICYASGKIFKPSTPFKKDAKAELIKEINEWEQLYRTLSTKLRQMD